MMLKSHWDKRCLRQWQCHRSGGLPKAIPVQHLIATHFETVEFSHGECALLHIATFLPYCTLPHFRMKYCTLPHFRMKQLLKQVTYMNNSTRCHVTCKY